MHGVPTSSTPSVNEYAATLRKQLDSACSLAWSHSLLSHLRQKEIYDRKVHGRLFKRGDLVWLHSPLNKKGINKKLYHPWSGPHRVVKKLSDANYRIEQVQGRKNRKIVHFDRLKLCPQSIHLTEETNIQELYLVTRVLQSHRVCYQKIYGKLSHYLWDTIYIS